MIKRKIVCALAVLIAAALLLVFGKGGSRLQVHLRVKQPGDTFSVVYAAPKATISNQHGGGDEKQVRFSKGVLQLDIPYGVTTVKGCFAWEDIQAAWPDSLLREDWPFSFSVFSTGTDGRKDTRISVTCDPVTNGASATMYFFYDFSPEPVVLEWTGAIGEPIAFGFEV